MSRQMIAGEKEQTARKVRSEGLGETDEIKKREKILQLYEEWSTRELGANTSYKKHGKMAPPGKKTTLTLQEVWPRKKKKGRGFLH